MAIRIGHASLDENRKAAGGQAGDQTGGEVCVRSWYNGGWEYLARAVDAGVAEKIALACEAGCGNPHIGYDQNQRNTLNARAKERDYDLSGIDTACETDCSAFVSVCLLAAGVSLPYMGNLPTTRTLKSALRRAGGFEIRTEALYLTGTGGLRRGDILCKPGSHTVIVLDNGEAQSAWENHLLPVLRRGCSGETVKALQLLLTGFGFDCGKWGADGEFGSATEGGVKAFQRAKGLEADGVAGQKTWVALLGIG